MIPLSNVLDNYFRKKISIILTVTFLCALAVAVLFGYLKSKNDLKSTLQVSTSIYSSLLYSKDWDLLNKFSSVLINDHNLQSIKIESKENGNILYHYSNNQNRLIPVHCSINSDSEIIRLSICRNTIVWEYLSYLTGIVLLFALVAYMFFLRSKRSAVYFFDEIAKKITDILGNEIKPGSTFHIKELNDLHSNLMEKSQRIEKLAKSAAVVDISRKVAHDLRSPASVIAMSTGKKAISENELILISKAALRIKEISSSLLDQTRFNYPLPNMIRVPLLETLNNLIEEKKAEYEGRDLKIEIETLIKDEVYIWSNAQDFMRAVSNLINNSIESLGGNSHCCIKIYLGNIGDFFCLKFLDSGPGFSEEFLEKYNRGEIASTKIDGNALGLDSVIQLSKGLGGQVELRNGPSGGAIVEIKLKASSILSKNYPIVQIDDDKYVRAAWVNAAREKSLKLISVASYAEFLKHEGEIPNGAEFFIDYNLGNGERGDDIVLKLSQKGYAKINYATGQDFSSSSSVQNVNRIIGKNFPY